jgi:hypothetical protein
MVETKESWAKALESLSAQEIYANRILAVSFDGSAVVLTLGMARPHIGSDQSQSGAIKPESTVHVTSRIALSVVAALELKKLLANLTNIAEQKMQQAAKEG